MERNGDLISRQAAIDALWSLDAELRPSAIGAILNMLNGLTSAQPELIEQSAYVRGFEQGRTQGMIDAQGGEEMNKQRKVVITITYNEMGIIVDTKAEELSSSAQPERKTGKWLKYDLTPMIPYQYSCSNCGAYHRVKYDFCPSCGADMRGDEDER